MATWLVETSTVVAPMRAANCRWASGGITWSPSATRNEDGSERPTHSSRKQAVSISLNTSPPVRRRPRWSGLVVPVGSQCGCGARRLLSMASAVVTLIVKGGRSAMSDVAGLDLLPHLNEEVVHTVCVDRAPLNTTSVIVPLVDRCHRSGWLPIRVWTNSSADLDSTRRRRLLLSHSALDPRAYRAGSSSPWRFAAPYRRAHSPRRTTGRRRPLRIAQTDTRSP
jgi:hypothetical protein